jgi:hypothetical protein
VPVQPCAGTTVSFSAQPNSHSVFAGWSGACSGTGTCQVTTSATPAVTVTAAFRFVNAAPVANAGGPYTGFRNQAIAFNGSGSTDPDGDALTYAWDFGDGTTGTGVAPAHAYSTLGTFTVTLRVNDGHATSAPATTSVTIVNAPQKQRRSRPDWASPDHRAPGRHHGSRRHHRRHAWQQVIPIRRCSCWATASRSLRSGNVHDPVVLEFELQVTDNDGAIATDRVGSP